MSIKGSFRQRLLEEGLINAINVILKLAPQCRPALKADLNYSFFEQIQELTSLDSVVDLLKFVNTEPSTLHSCPKIQHLLKQSFPLISENTGY